MQQQRANSANADARRASGNHGAVIGHGASIPALNQLLADTLTLRDLYKKHQWQVTGGDFYPLQILFEKSGLEQSRLADLMAERITALGGDPVAMPHDVARMTRLARPPKGREKPADEISRLLDAHELILGLSANAADMAEARGDKYSFALLDGEAVRVNEMQIWSLLQHLSDLPPVEQRV
jgi:starvation-inducible DNA-binding protein